MNIVLSLKHTTNIVLKKTLETEFFKDDKISKRMESDELAKNIEAAKRRNRSKQLTE